MKHKQWLLMAGLAVVAVVVMTSPVKADFFFKQVVVTDPVKVMGQTQPGRADTSSIWISEGKACMMSGNNSFLFFSDGDKLIMIDHSARTYSEMPLDVAELVEEVAEGEEGAEEGAEMTKAMMEAMMGSVKITVTPTSETKKIGDWNTTKYIMNMTMPMGNTTSELWTTGDIEVDYDAFKSVANAGMMMMPGFDDILEEMKKIKGITVYSVTSADVMGSTVKSTMEMLEFFEKDAPAGTYDVPEGFKKVDLMDMSPH